MSGLASFFWQFDSQEFAKMHQAEYEARKAWLKKKIEDCNRKIAQGVLSAKIRLMIVEDRVMYEDILKAMYGEEVNNG
ncbi:hypothetical protein QNI19_14690 [Cytophagaceae bacterium DM2B3-1]|uniref:Uncharacterized protein n=1 Tax=Xanthocytophaga flava TaxID=3048013 RepID=A0ABT7CKH4_9BACT|nr:hypothetical protein [Xanthocytophaga flavus]MDJ1494188.1 hypothetical protein [Xanthocytophaga flavus]